jgi:hypothetical protein
MELTEQFGMLLKGREARTWWCGALGRVARAGRHRIQTHGTMLYHMAINWWYALP